MVFLKYAVLREGDPSLRLKNGCARDDAIENGILNFKLSITQFLGCHLFNFYQLNI